MTRVYGEIVDFIAGGSSPDEVARFQPSQDLRDRVADLVSRAKESALTPEETADLDLYLELEHIMRLAKAKARYRPEVSEIISWQNLSPSRTYAG